MQLFITNQFTLIDSWALEISDPRVFHQCIKVLRYKAGDKITLQNENIRFTCKFVSWNKNTLQCSIIHSEHKPDDLQTTGNIIIAMVNKRDKMELIAQKCTELWISELGIWNARRSMISVFPEKKLERLHLIMLEAAEQSWNRDIPRIKIYHSINTLPDFSFYAHQSSNSVYNTICNIHANRIKTIIIGPEWWFDNSEIEYFEKHNYISFSLWTSILRTETAAILSARLCNQ